MTTGLIEKVSLFPKKSYLLTGIHLIRKLEEEIIISQM